MVRLGAAAGRVSFCLHKSAGGISMQVEETSKNVISKSKYEAVIFDLDGVVTKTAEIHAAAWKALFNRYLTERGTRLGEAYRKFDEGADYRRYVDGKPRYDGVKSFLASRNIELPYGDPGDAPDTETICGLGNRKNVLFHDLLKRVGVDVYPSTINLIKSLQVQNFKTAIVSSSKNCTAVLEAAGITQMFDVQVDGTDSERLQLKGKPAPDIFLEAAGQLGVPPDKAVVIEDALAGVKAGRDGHFGLVIGVDRDDSKEEFQRRGADWVLKDLAEISVVQHGPAFESNTERLPSALDRWDEIRGRAAGRRWVVFLDYDGTLTPIVARPEDARLSGNMRRTLAELARKCTVAVISGRDLKDVQQLVGIDGILYAGSHGFDISGPKLKYRHGLEFLASLDRAEEKLEEKLGGISGVRIERKTFSIAIHYRQVQETDVEAVEKGVNAVLPDFPSLRKAGGKKIFEFQPKVDWNKGKALLWILQKLELDTSTVSALYIGDDLTDEDAFRVLAADGIGIVVRDEPRPTLAAYALNSPDEVRQLLELVGSVG